MTGASLARRGFLEPERAAALLAAVAAWPDAPTAEELAEDLSTVADPDQAIALLARLVEAQAALGEREARRMVATLGADRDARRRLLDVLGLSQALGDFLVRHPSSWELLLDAEALAQAPSAAAMRAALVDAVVGADPRGAGAVDAHGDDAALDRLRIAYRRHLLGIAARDLAGLAPVDDVAAWLSDLADGVLAAALEHARRTTPGSERARLAVIAMGKAGGRELNYVSDVDVIFVAEPAEGEADEAAALAIATAMATALMRACSRHTAEGAIWEVDPNLRPEGRQGALVRTLASHAGYYERWAATWEFQALLKARFAAGDPVVGAAYVDAVAPLVWSAADREGFVDDVQAMRRRVERHVPAKVADRELKLGPGGLRDVEFSVQLLQLVHGRSDALLRSPTTLTALEALATWGYVGRDDAATLGAAYRFLRSLEHRIQLHGLRRTHELPEGERDLRRLGRSLGFAGDPVEGLAGERRRHAREVRRLHEKLFYRPLLRAVARLDAGEARLSPEAAGERLRALGYADPVGAIRHLEALTTGVSRRAAIQRTLLPVMLGWFADGPDPDAGLLGFRRVSDALGSTHWYLGLLRDESVAAERMARILASSRYATDLLLGSPDAVAILADDAELAPRPVDALLAEARAAVGRHDDPGAAIAAVRGLRRRELLRVSASRLVGTIDDATAMAALTGVARAALEGALAVALREEASGVPDLAFSVIGMGRLGGGELGLGSDVDVMFAFDGGSAQGESDEEASRAAIAVATALRSLLMAPGDEPPLEVDADLRPEGRHGALVRSLASYRAYYERWSSPWEAQALLRAIPVAGDERLGAALMAVIDPVRYPESGIDEQGVREVRRLKARMEAERLPRGADATLHLKLGRGGLSDVEWVVQLLQLRHAWQVPALRTTGTLEALDAARDAGLLVEADAEGLAHAWQLATRVRDAVLLARGRPSDLVPTDPRDLAATAFVLGYPLGSGGRLLEDYRRVTRRARAIVERTFYGIDPSDGSGA